MKIFNKFIWSKREPSNKNDVWFDGSSFKIYNGGDWETAAGGIPIVSSIEELDPNASSGTMAVIAKGSLNTISIADVYFPSEEDFLLDEETLFVKLLNADKLTLVKGIDLHTPPSNYEYPQAAFMGILLNKYAVDAFAKGLDLGNPNANPLDETKVKMGIFYVTMMPNPEDPENLDSNIVMIGGAAGGSDVLNNMGNPEDLAFAQHIPEVGFVIDNEKLDSFNKQLEEDDYYFLTIMTNGLEGDIPPKEIIQILRGYDNVFKISSGGSKPKVYIKNQEWEVFLEEDFNSLKNSINLVNQSIPIKVSQLENDVPYLTAEDLENLNNLEITDISTGRNTVVLKDGELIRIYGSQHSTIYVTIDEEVPFHKGYIQYDQPLGGTTFVGDNIKVISSDIERGTHLIEFTKIAGDALPIIGRSMPLDMKNGMAYVRIEIESIPNNSYIHTALANLNALNTMILYNRETALSIEELGKSRNYYPEDVVEIWYSHGDLSIDCGYEAYVNIYHRSIENTTFNISKGGRYNVNITLDTDYDKSFVQDYDAGWLASRTDLLKYTEGLKRATIPSGDYFAGTSNNMVWDVGVNHVALPSTIEEVRFKVSPKKVSVPSEETYWRIFNKYRFSDTDSVIINGKEGKTIDLTVPDNVSTLASCVGNTFSELHSLKLTNNITNIQDCAFSNPIIHKLILPETYEYWKPNIGLRAFRTIIKEIAVDRTDTALDLWRSGNSLIKVKSTYTSPLGITSEIIAPYALYKCVSIPYVTLYSSVKEIKEGVFEGTSISYYDCLGCTDVPKLSNNASFGSADYRIVVPQDKYEEWVASEGWSNYEDKIVGASSIYHFTAGLSYITEAEYTWEQYIDSKFCNGPFTIVDGVVKYANTNTVQLDSVNVLATDTIKNYTNYEIVSDQ